MIVVVDLPLDPVVVSGGFLIISPSPDGSVDAVAECQVVIESEVQVGFRVSLRTPEGLVVTDPDTAIQTPFTDILEITKKHLVGTGAAYAAIRVVAAKTDIAVQIVCDSCPGKLRNR